MSEDLVKYEVKEVDVVMGFGTKAGFELMQRAASLLSSSMLVPKDFQGSIPNCVIALEMAARIGASPLMVAQNLYIVHGKPSWSSQFIIAAVNGTGKFSPLRFQISEETPEETVVTSITSYDWENGKKSKKVSQVSEKIKNKICIAWATEKVTGERLESPPISLRMAVLEGWFSKDGSKWKTMPELMLRYRAATLFGRLYAPEILMGMKAYEEIIDIEGEDVTKKETSADKLQDRLKKAESVATGPSVGGDAIGNDLSPSVEFAPGLCPDRPDELVPQTKEYCDQCKSRKGCPTWQEVDKAK